MSARREHLIIDHTTWLVNSKLCYAIAPNTHARTHARTHTIHDRSSSMDYLSYVRLQVFLRDHLQITHAKTLIVEK